MPFLMKSDLLLSNGDVGAGHEKTVVIPDQVREGGDGKILLDPGGFLWVELCQLYGRARGGMVAGRGSGAGLGGSTDWLGVKVVWLAGTGSELVGLDCSLMTH